MIPCTAIGIDVGGTKTAAGLILLPAGEVLARRQIPTELKRGPDALLTEVLRLANELAAEARDRKKPVDSIGLGICELVDPNGRILSANCVAWEGVPVQERLSQVAPAVVEADVRAAALAEAVFGAGQSYRVFLYVTVGTGISSCLVLDGHPFTGARGATGTMASSPLSLPCENCGHISHRTLEEIASGPALVTRFNERRPGAARTGHDVLAAAAAGDAAANEVVHAAGHALESIVGLLVNVLDPEAVILGGGLGLSEGAYWENFVTATRRHIWSSVHRNLPILRAATGPDAGWMGAAVASWRKLAGIA